jgi:valyl-tRNA synthetase
MPFVTEEVYSNLILEDKADSIMISDWPKAEEIPAFPEEADMMTHLMAAIKSVRNIRTEMGVPPSRKAHVILVTPDAKTAKMFVDGTGFLERLASVSSLETRTDKDGIPATAVAAIFDGGEIYMPLEDLIDISKELERLNKEKDNLIGEIKRSESKLSNESFVSRAPEKVVNAEKEKLAKHKEMYKGIEERIAMLAK